MKFSTVNLNRILKKFNYKSNLIKEYNCWYWLLRDEQVTIGSSILINKYHHLSFSGLNNEELFELRKITCEIENSLNKNFDYQRINYLMLMMNDPTVHFHVIPRYDTIRLFEKNKFYDYGYPGIPSLDLVNNCDKKLKEQIINKIKEKI